MSPSVGDGDDEVESRWELNPLMGSERFTSGGLRRLFRLKLLLGCGFVEGNKRYCLCPIVAVVYFDGNSLQRIYKTWYCSINNMSVENCLVKAIYSFKGKNNDELCFKKGDIITVTQREEGGWWEGTLGETTGWFPSNYVTEYKDTCGSVTTSPIRAPSEIQAFRNVVLKDIIDSEKAHVAEMQGLVSNFLQPLEKSDMLSWDEFKQLTGNINEVLETHEQLLTLLEKCAAKTGPDQRVGGLFLQWAPKIKAVHQTYCAHHPKAVCILDKYKEELNSWMESTGAVCPGVLVLTAGLSKPFRRLGKYPAMLQELARHVHEGHPDRGDTYRASVVYKDIASGCSGVRRQKELELQVVTGEVRGWPGGDVAALGDVLHMGSVAVGPAHKDRYLVLFSSALLLLSVSKRVSAFVYEGCLPLTGITVQKLDDMEARKNAFEISGPMIDSILAACQTKAEAENWVSLLQKHSTTSSPAHEPGQPHSLPHMARNSDSNSSDLSSGLTSHKRSHSFNNHQSYTQHSQKTQKSKQNNHSARWLLNSGDSLDQSPAKSNKSLEKKLSVDFIDTTDSNYSNKGWSIKCLRPAPPLRPQAFAAGSDENIGPTHPYSPHQRKSNSYEEDALILRVIEAYCTSARCRNAFSSECDEVNPAPLSQSLEALARSLSLPLHAPAHAAPSLWHIILRLQSDVKSLKMDVKNLNLQLKEEKQERTLAIFALNSKSLRDDASESKC